MKYRLIIFLLIIVAIITITGGVYWKQLGFPSIKGLVVDAGPINWTPERITVVIAPGGFVRMPVSLITTEEFDNAEITIDQKLTPFISATETKFRKVQAGRWLRVDLVVSAATNTPLQTIDGLIKLRTSGGVNIAKPLPVTVEISSNPPAAPAVLGIPRVYPQFIVATESRIIRLIIAIPDRSLLIGSVNLVRIGAEGEQFAVLGTLRDDGQGGDAQASDRIFTIQQPFNEPGEGQVHLQVSAEFEGVPTRVVSPAISVPVIPFLDAEQTLDAFAGYLSAGNIDAAVGLMSSPRQQELFRTLNAETLANVVGMIENRTLRVDTPDYRIYDGFSASQARQIEFRLFRTWDGQWKIQF